MHGREGNFVKIVDRGHHLGDLNINGKIILKWLVKRYGDDIE
jgi:hypothetical protein